MTWAPNATWLAASAQPVQKPVYFLRIDGLTVDYSTHPVLNAGTEKVALMDLPSGGGGSLNLLDGTRTINEVEVTLYDLGGVVTELLATEAPSAPLSTLINRKCTLYAGYASLDEADYEPIYSGRIVKPAMTSNTLGYTLTIASQLKMLLSKKIMVDAGEVDDPADPQNKIARPTRIEGNIVNIVYSILSGTFSTTGSFPLVSFSSSSSTSSAPTGIGIAAAQLDAVRIAAERDYWYPDDTAEIVFTEPADGKDYLEREFFRVFQAQSTISGAGLLGIKFVISPPTVLGLASITETDHIISVKWHRAYEQHINKLTYKGDYDGEPSGTGQYETTYDVSAPEDATDQSATEETIEYLIESKWLSSDRDGGLIASELAGRIRSMYAPAPVFLDIEINFTKRSIEEGDVVLVTHRRIPDMLLGTRGVTNKPMLVLSTKPNFEKGTVTLQCLDSSYRRFGVIAPADAPNYESANATEKATYFYISDASGLMTGGDPGYRAA